MAGRRSQARNRSQRVRLLELGQHVLAGLGVGQQLAQAFLLDERVEERLVVEGRSQQVLSLRVGERVGGVSAEPLLRVAGHRPSSPATPATKPQRSPSSVRRRWWQRKSQL